MKNGVLLFVSIILASASGGAAQRIPETIIRVGIMSSKPSCNISGEGNYHIYELRTGTKVPIKPSNDYLVRGRGSSIVISGQAYSSPVRLISENSENFLRINGRRYRDNVSILCDNGKLTIVNELGIEDYLYGILPMEVNPAWPEESLKAQAIVSRTYVLRNLRRHAKEGFDVCSLTHCQVYGGMEPENERSNKAVGDTRGEVLVFDGQLAQALFHASCGGHTENPNNVWIWDSDAPPYLKGGTDAFCKNSPHNRWENKLSAPLIAAKLAKAGYKVGKNIERIRMEGKDRSGRTKTLKIKSDKGTVAVPAARFRLIVDPWLMKSTLLNKIKPEGKYFVFAGQGWGHGVGMCQWGAKEMAEKGRDYRKILSHFYPGTEVEKWEE